MFKKLRRSLGYIGGFLKFIYIIRNINRHWLIYLYPFTLKCLKNMWLSSCKEQLTAYQKSWEERVFFLKIIQIFISYFRLGFSNTFLCLEFSVFTNDEFGSVHFNMANRKSEDFWSVQLVLGSRRNLVSQLEHWSWVKTARFCLHGAADSGW